MADKTVPDIFADQGGSLSLINGVYRLTLTQQRFASDGEAVDDDTRPVGRLLIPANKLDGVVDGIVSAIDEIAAQLRPPVESEPESDPNPEPVLEIAPKMVEQDVEIELEGAPSPKQKSRWGFEVLKRLIGD